jgi:hypothetical protein
MNFQIAPAEPSEACIHNRCKQAKIYGRLFAKGGNDRLTIPIAIGLD